MAAYTSPRAAFEILREVCASPEPVGVTELSRRLGISSSTTQRILQVLSQSGYLSRHPKTPKYSIGFTAERLVNAVLERYPIRAVSLLPLRRLAVSSQRTASLYVRLGWYSIRIAGIEAGHNSAHLRRLGDVSLLSGEAPSLAILSLLAPEEIACYREFADSAAEANLDKRLEDVRQAGFAYTAASADNGLESFAIPLRAGSDIIRAAIAIEGPPGAEPLNRHPQQEQWQAAARDFENLLKRKAQVYTDPFAHLNPDQIHFRDRH